MKVIKLFLFTLILSISISVVDRASATCYKHCYKDDCIYSTSPVIPDQVDKIPSLVECISNNKDNEDICFDTDYTMISVNDDACKEYSSGKNYDPKNIVSCGEGMLTDIPKIIPKTVHIFYLLIQIAVPILLVVFGSIDFIKGLTSQKDEDIKKGQQTFIKRLIAAGILFFVFSIVKIIISFAADSDKSANILKCTSCIINNNKECKGA